MGEHKEIRHRKSITNKKVLLRESKRHTARRVASTCCASLSSGGYLPLSGILTLAVGEEEDTYFGGGIYTGQGVPILSGGT